MKKIFTLFTMGMLCLAANKANAQITETFEATLPSCFTIQNSSVVSGGINNTKSIELPNNTTANNTSIPVYITTPYLDFTTTTATISFDYLFASRINGNKGRDFRIGTVDQNGTITYSNSFTYTLDNKSTTAGIISLGSNSPTSGTINVSMPISIGTKRIIIEYNGDGGKTKGFFDNLKINGTYHYQTYCNSIPNALNDSYSGTSAYGAVPGNVLSNDTDADKATLNETLTVVLPITQPAEGTLNMLADGSFTFTPNASFKGGSVTFTYTVKDNGYMSASASATATITYPYAPVANNDQFAVGLISATATGNVTTNDTKPNGINLTASLVKKPVSGDLVLNADGTFTYTPAEGFKGGDVTFTYNVTDAKYAPLYSNVATVTITYPEASILPVKITSFAVNAQGSKAQLYWNVEDNETGSYFEVQKSTDGKSFKNAVVIFNTTKPGTAAYQHTDAADLNNAIYYRLKVVNKDNSVSYSKIVVVRNAGTVAEDKLTLLQNPVQSTVTLSLTATANEVAEVALYNMAGVKVYSQKVSTVKGANSISLNLDSKVIKGNYVLEVQSSNTRKAVKMIKQ